MSAVERALEKQWGPRPSPVPPDPPTETPRMTQTDPPWRGRIREPGQFTELQTLMIQLVKNLPRSST